MKRAAQDRERVEARSGAESKNGWAIRAQGGRYAYDTPPFERHSLYCAAIELIPLGNVDAVPDGDGFGGLHRFGVATPEMMPTTARSASIMMFAAALGTKRYVVPRKQLPEHSHTDAMLCTNSTDVSRHCETLQKAGYQGRDERPFRTE